MGINAADLKARIEAGEPIEIVDIREADEYVDWHIHGSRNLPVYNALKNNDEGPLRESAGALPRDRTIVAVCRAGILSQRAAGVLSSLGYEVTSLDGGIRGWGGVWTEASIPFSAGVCVQIRRNGKGCLSYLFGSKGQGAVVDPSVEVQAYLDAAKERDLEISHVFETHVHADHLSRARDLCRATGACLIMHPNQRVTYEYQALSDGETIQVGDVTVEVVATPGHTTESVCYLLGDEVLLTGDTLFVENVGRPDLEKGDAGAEAGARLLYHSLKECLLGRFDTVRVYAAHHSKPINFAREPIGAPLDEIRGKLTLMDSDEEGFVRAILDSLQPKPPNHESIIAVNEGNADAGGMDPLDLEAGPNRCAAG